MDHDPEARRDVALVVVPDEGSENTSGIGTKGAAPPTSAPQLPVRVGSVGGGSIWKRSIRREWVRAAAATRKGGHPPPPSLLDDDGSEQRAHKITTTNLRREDPGRLGIPLKQSSSSSPWLVRDLANPLPRLLYKVRFNVSLGARPRRGCAVCGVCACVGRSRLVRGVCSCLAWPGPCCYPWP
jgi:hypothetical protein